MTKGASVLHLNTMESKQIINNPSVLKKKIHTPLYAYIIIDIQKLFFKFHIMTLINNKVDNTSV